MELAFVEPRALAEGEEVDLVAVVPDEDHPRLERLAVDRAAQVMPAARRLEDRACAGQRLPAAAVVLTPVDEPGVDAEGHVVEEEPVARLADVDAPLSCVVVERCERTERVVPVEADVAGEMIARPEGDADERRAGLERDPRDRSERAVAARRAEHRRTGGACELRGIVSLLQEMRLDAESRAARSQPSGPDRRRPSAD